MKNLDHLLSPTAVGIIRAAGLHKVAGVMTGVGEVTAAKAAGLLGAKAYVRRKTAHMVADGIISLAAAEKIAVSSEAAAHLRRSVAPATKGAR